MATLVSPGVAVSVIDESFYGSAGAGTVPLIIVASSQDKADGTDSTATAGYTTSATAIKPHLITSQRELLQQYGKPYFKSVSGTVQQGYETNEYGLLAAYSYLGAANRAYIMRADVNTSQLEPSSTEPTSAPPNGAWWWDLGNTTFGLFEYKQVSVESSAWVAQTVTIPTATATDITAGNVPEAAFGSNGDYALVPYTLAGVPLTAPSYYKKDAGAWATVESGNSGITAVWVRPHYDPPAAPNIGDVWIKLTTANSGMNISYKEYSTTSTAWASRTVGVFASDAMACIPGNITSGTQATATAVAGTGGSDALQTADITLVDGGSGYTEAPTVVITDPNGSLAVATATIGTNGKVTGVTVTTPGSGYTTAATITFIGGTQPAADSVYIRKTSDATAGGAGEIQWNGGTTHVAGTEETIAFYVFPGSSTTSVALGAASVPIALNADGTTPTADKVIHASSAPTAVATDGTYWYDTTLALDIYKKASGAWQKQAVSKYGTTAPAGPSDGDVWIDTNDLDNYPVIKVYDSANAIWTTKDNTDQSTADGVVFADLTPDTGVTAGQSPTNFYSGYPNPAIYPDGMFAVNGARSSYHVRKYDENATLSTSAVAAWKWVTAAGNKANGAGLYGRKSQRKVVTTAMQAALTSCVAIREESYTFSIIASPGYPELADEMNTLATDRKNTAFVVIDPPFRLATSGVASWMLGTSTTENGEDGLVSKTAYSAVYYPSAYTTDLDGNTVTCPASHIALRTFAYNDDIAYPWFAPAGLTRGVIANATNIGYLDSEDEFVPVALSGGDRDTLYQNKVNPLANFPGQGIFVYGQKTLNPTTSALDRVNVARLIVYLRERLDVLARPFVFEPNDELTRANAKDAVERFLADILAKRGLYDFAVVCDSTNNTPARIDKNEMYIDVAIEPTKAAEFIYIPIRVVNTGDLSATS